MLRAAQASVSTATQTAQAQGNQTRAAISGFVEGVTASLQARVLGIAADIGGLIDAIPVPDLPGVAQLRAAASGMVRRASGAVSSGLATVRGLIGSALRTGMQLVGSALSGLQQLADAALARVAGGIQRGLQTALGALSTIGSTVINSARALLIKTVLPTVNRLERQAMQGLANAQRQAVAAIRANRDNHLQALAVALKPRSDGPAGGSSTAGSPAGGGDGAAVLRAIGQEAVQNNSQILRTFYERTGGIIGAIFQSLGGVVARIGGQIGNLIARAVQAVGAKIAEIIQGLARLAAAVSGFVQSLLGDLADKLNAAVDVVREFVQSPIDQLLQFAQGALSRVTQFVGQFVRNLLRQSQPSQHRGCLQSGDFPRADHQAATSGWSYYLAWSRSHPGRAVGCRRPGGDGCSGAGSGHCRPDGAWPDRDRRCHCRRRARDRCAARSAVADICALSLVETETRSVAATPDPPCSITTRTLVAAPDGSPDTRSTVGVNEQVEMRSSAPATWAATGGTLSGTSGTVVTWTAPAAAATSAVTAIAASGTPCSVSMTAIPPSSNSFANPPAPRPYTAGLAGSGFLAMVTVMPSSVSFTRLEVREETVAGVAVGYYDTVLKWNGIMHPIGEWIRVGVDNGGGTDTVGSNPPGTPGPFSLGTFTWPIPQSYRAVGSTAGTHYGTATHTQVMTGTNGAETTSKQGAIRSRTP